MLSTHPGKTVSNFMANIMFKLPQNPSGGAPDTQTKHSVGKVLSS